MTRTFAMQFQSTVKSLLTARLNALDAELIGIEARLEEFSDQVAPSIAEALKEYGLGLVAFSIAALNITAYLRVSNAAATTRSAWTTSRRSAVHRVTRPYSES